MNFRVLIDKARCKGCALCVAVCPRAVLHMVRKLNAAGYHYPKVKDADRCTGCAQCALICPDAAIEIEKADARPGRRPAKKRKN